jgi:hypothetical protein
MYDLFELFDIDDDFGGWLLGLFVTVSIVVTVMVGVAFVDWPDSQNWYEVHDAERNAKLVQCKAHPVELSSTQVCINAVRANEVRLKRITDVEFARILEQPARNKP